MSINERTRRVALLSVVSIPVPLLGRAAAVPIVVAGVLSMVSLASNRAVTRLIPWRSWRDDQQTVAVVGLAAVLGFLSLLFNLPLYLLVTALLVYGCGSLGASAVSVLPKKSVRSVLGFSGGAWTASLFGQLVFHGFSAGWPVPLAEPVFLATIGSLIGALAYSVLLPADEWLSLPLVAGSLWLLALVGSPTMGLVLLALALTLSFGTIAFRLRAASASGVLAGGLCLTLATVLGGPAWALILLVFFACGSLLSGFNRSQMHPQHIRATQARPRSAGNVLANAGASTGAVVLYALADAATVVSPRALMLAFVGGIAAATSDTVASEIGERYEHPWLITSFERVQPGTDGAVSLTGTLAGIGGAATIAVCAGLLFAPLVLPDIVLLTAIGTTGMLLDSVLGATVEGQWVANDGVNFLATTTTAIGGLILATVPGL